jgi:hypothetical protein
MATRLQVLLLALFEVARKSFRIELSQNFLYPIYRPLELLAGKSCYKLMLRITCLSKYSVTKLCSARNATKRNIVREGRPGGTRTLTQATRSHSKSMCKQRIKWVGWVGSKKGAFWRQSESMSRKQRGFELLALQQCDYMLQTAIENRVLSVIIQI